MVMAVVKADAYGHGMIPVAKKLEAAGADYLGVADISEALELREAGIDLPILAWLHSAGNQAFGNLLNFTQKACGRYRLEPGGIAEGIER
jgi:alanine racemase